MAVSQSQIKVDSIEGYNAGEAVVVSYGASVPPGSFCVVSGNLNVSGVVTATSHSGTNINSTGIITATSFVGDGSQLSNLPVLTTSKTIAYAFLGF